jgi:hypothetical protein
MLDSRVYRAAFVPVVLAILVAAFALGERPRPIRTTLAPDAFDGRRAFATLTELARTFPRTRPGTPGDAALAARIEREMRAAFATGRRGVGSVSVDRRTVRTYEGEQEVATVVGTRPGLDERRIVVVAERDRPVEGDAARLSGTAALLELVRLYGGRATRRTLVFVSTSGGAPVLRDLPALVDGPVDAVLVAGDVASREVERPTVVPWASSGGIAPLRLRRTVESAVELESDIPPGSPRALIQLTRLAVPMSLTPQGVLGAEGLSAVTLQVSGEDGPDPGAEPSQALLQAFGRGLLRSITALDNGPDVPAGPREYVLFSGRIVPPWAVSLIAGLLLLPALLGAVDGLARVRRRKHAVAVWLRWLVVGALPFLAAYLVARLLGLAGMVEPLPAPVDPAALPPEAAVLVVLALVVVLGLLVRGPLARLAGARALPRAEDVPGAAAAVALATCLVAIAVWVVNPFTALLLVPAVHLWLLAVVPEVRLPRPVLVGMVLLGLLPLLLAARFFAGMFGWSPVELAWQLAVAMAGGTAGPLGALAFSLFAGCGVAALLVAVRKRRPEPADDPEVPVSIRGPLSYAGPGSLGGTESALRR